MSLKSLFTKKKEETPVINEDKKEEHVSYTDFLISIGRKVGRQMSDTQAAERFKKLFPRTIENIKPMKMRGGKMVAQDSDIPFAQRFTNEIPKEILGFLNQTFIGWQACSLLKQNPFIDRACSIPAKDAIAPDYKLAYINPDDQKADDDDKTTDMLAEIKDKSYREFGINDICVRHTINKKTFGYSLVIPVVDGVDMEKPYNIDGVKKGSYKGMAVVEPYWITTELDADAATNPSSRHFYYP